MKRSSYVRPVCSARRLRAVVTLSLMAAAAVVLTGCSSRDYEGAERASFSGTVTLDGEPVETGTVYLLPGPGAEDGRISGATIQEGAFEVPEPKGPNLGTYKVAFELTRPTGKYRGVDESGVPYDPIYQDLTPPSLSRDRSQETVEIQSGANVFQFDVAADGTLNTTRQE